MNALQEMTFGSLGKIFDGPHATPTRVDSGPYFLNISSFKSGHLDLSESDHVSDEDFSRWTRRVTPQAGDLLFSYETRLGDAALMPADIKACLGRRMALLRPDRRVVDPKFLLYFYLSQEFQQTIEQHTVHGATVNRIPLKTMGGWPVRIPSLATQQAIAEVLGALDDKIAANTKLATTADELIRASFVDLTNEATETQSIANLATQGSEKVDPSTLAPTVPYVGLEHFTRRHLWIDNHGSSEDVTSSKSRFRRDDILFGKLRPYFHKVALAPNDGISSTDVIVVRPREAGLSGFTLAAISSDSVIETVTARSEGTRMPRTSWRELSLCHVPWPGEAKARQFSEEVGNISRSIESAYTEAHSLAETRDALLPQLMSGKIRVKDAEAILQGAGV
ncbi:restriction endonuclease subunit S [Zhihengliuella halotolerans]|uniref:Type I restriction enzyme S subunit n=1 Tax=Zhihengliuella halotolerans TaxID=370736 RepID=A0A4Q8AF73_9MICC|nr:restriction endonuclease subunit S [Zhihengliuella halotolerans]RZU62854.1 type I restriction enzyme S subunit [Zhihengliuella halotolerans]